MADNLRTYSQLLPYLTPKAKDLIQQFQDAGVEDRDLCITLAEMLLPEEELYELAGSEQD